MLSLNYYSLYNKYTINITSFNMMYSVFKITLFYALIIHLYILYFELDHLTCYQFSFSEDALFPFVDHVLGEHGLRRKKHSFEDAG